MLITRLDGYLRVSSGGGSSEVRDWKQIGSELKDEHKLMSVVCKEEVSNRKL